METRRYIFITIVKSIKSKKPIIFITEMLNDIFQRCWDFTNVEIKLMYTSISHFQE